MIVILCMLLAQSLMAQSLVFPGPGGMAGGGSGGMGPWSLVNHGATPGLGNDSNVGLAPMNCTGTNLYVIGTMSYGTPPVIGRWDPGGGDSHDMPNSTGWTVSGSVLNTGFFWDDGVTGGSSIQFTTRNNYGPLLASCWGGAAATPAKDQESASGSMSCYPCTLTLTPTAGGTLLLVIAGLDPGTAPSTSLTAAGFTVVDTQEGAGGVSASARLFYKVLGAGTSGVPQSVTISSGTGGAGSAKMVNFKHQ